MSGLKIENRFDFIKAQTSPEVKLGEGLIKSIKNRGDNFSASGLGVDKTTAFSSQDLQVFKRDNRDLLYVISKSDKAKELLSKKDIRTRADLENIVSQTAHDLLEGEAQRKLSVEDLKDNGLLSKLIVLNVGGLRDLINKDSDVAFLVSSGSVQAQGDVYQQLAQKAAALFDDDHVLNDEGFFYDNPKAAIYLLNRPDVVSRYKSFSTGEASARQFKDEIFSVSNQAILDDHVASFAAAETDSGTFNSSYFSDVDNIDVATFVAASSILQKDPVAAQVLKANPQYALENPATGDNFNIDQIISEVYARQASHSLSAGHSLSLDILRGQEGLSRLIIKNSQFRNALEDSASKKDLAAILSTQAAKESSEIKDLQKSFKSKFQEYRTVSIVT